MKIKETINSSDRQWTCITVKPQRMATSLHKPLYFVLANSPYIYSLQWNLLQWQQPLKRVPNCQKNLSITASFFSDWWKSQESEWSWNLIHMAPCMMINQGRTLIVFHLWCCSRYKLILKANVACFVTLTFWFKT